MKVCVIIPAAGRSTRFGELDKLFQDLGGRPLLVRTVELFTKRDEVGSIIVGAPPDSLDQFQDRFGATLGFLGASIVVGGRTDRWETVRNALAEVPEDATHIAVHDAARPGVSRELLDRLLEVAHSRPAVVPGLRIASTIKRVSSESEIVGAAEEDAIANAVFGDVGQVSIEVRRVVETVPRDDLVVVQTPQIFDADLLRRAYQQDDLQGATDDAALVERLGEEVSIVEGEPNNFKITTPADLKLMRAVLGVKPPSKRPTHKQF